MIAVLWKRRSLRQRVLRSLVIAPARHVAALRGDRRQLAVGFHIGDARVDGEWLFVTYATAALGFGQLALDREDIQPTSLVRMEHCLDVMLDPRLRAFDRAAWGEDALEHAPDLSIAEIARKASCSFATAWQAAQDYRLLRAAGSRAPQG